MITPFSAPDPSDAFSPEEAWFDEDLTVPYEGQDRMRLVFAKGVSELSLRVDAAETALLRGRFDGFVPSVVVDRDEVAIRYRHVGLADWLGGLLRGERIGAAVVLHPGVTWELVFHGGASQVDIDLREGRMAGLELAGGASQVRLTLPAPDTVIPLGIRGGASELAVRRPAHVPVGVRIRGGASHLEIDGRHLGAVGGPIALDSDGWSTAKARYDLQLSGGASQLYVSA